MSLSLLWLLCISVYKKWSNHQIIKPNVYVFCFALFCFELLSFSAISQLPLSGKLSKRSLSCTNNALFCIYLSNAIKYTQKNTYQLLPSQCCLGLDHFFCFCSTHFACFTFFACSLALIWQITTLPRVSAPASLGWQNSQSFLDNEKLAKFVILSRKECIKERILTVCLSFLCFVVCVCFLVPLPKNDRNKAYTQGPNV